MRTDFTVSAILAEAERQLATMDIIRLTRSQWRAVEAALNPKTELERVREELEK